MACVFSSMCRVASVRWVGIESHAKGVHSVVTLIVGFVALSLFEGEIRCCLEIFRALYVRRRAVVDLLPLVCWR